MSLVEKLGLSGIFDLSEDTKFFLRPYVGYRDDTKEESKKRFLHSNRITFYGLVLHTVGLTCLFSPVTAPVGVSLITGGVLCDVLDGYVARQFDLCSEEGARLDPLFDKAKNTGFISIVGILESTHNPSFVEGVSEVITNPYFVVGAGVSLVLSYFLTRQRGDVLPQIEESVEVVKIPASYTLDDLENKISNDCEVKQVENKFQAKDFGKIKTFIESTTHVTYAFVITNPEYFSQMPVDVVTGVGIALGVSVVSGTIGYIDKLSNSNWGVFPNNNNNNNI
ncbi:MAG: CDP-alcohol phosphatidyltransferase family protein [Nanoarchaeales archaeon]|nr:CDP-alcohol phosphatidyltransferase family protein [Nanoarchaeales archaeon]